MLAHLGQAGLVNIDGKRRRTALARHTRSLDGFGRAAHGDGDDERARTDIRRRRMHELAARVHRRDDDAGLVLHEILRRIVAAVGAAGTDPDHTVDSARRLTLL